MKEFVHSLKGDYDESDVEVEDCFSSLYTMHRDVSIFDWVKAIVLENFTGKEHEAIEKGKTWNSFITAIRSQSVVQAIKILENESYTAEQNGLINNFYIVHTKAGHESIRFLSENMYALKISENFHFDSENDTISSDLQEPGQNSVAESSHSLPTNERVTYGLNEMELDILANLSKKRDTLIMIGLFVKLCKLQDRPKLKLQLSKKEFNLTQKYMLESVGEQTFSLIEEGRLKMPDLTAPEKSLTQNSVKGKNKNLSRPHERNANSQPEVSDDLPKIITRRMHTKYVGYMGAWIDSDLDSDSDSDSEIITGVTLF